LYTALMLQPRVIGIVTVVGVLIQSGWLFIALGIVLLWSAVVPAYNPFDASYNALVARRRRIALVSAAPAPRRFAMAMAGTMSLAIGVALFAGVFTLAWLLEGIFVFAVAAVVFANRCAGAVLYHVLRPTASSRAAA
jgi:hypothetical protein